MSAPKTTFASVVRRLCAGGFVRDAVGRTYPGSSTAKGSFSVAQRSTSRPNSRPRKPAYFAISGTVVAGSAQPRAVQLSKSTVHPTPSWIHVGSV